MAKEQTALFRYNLKRLLQAKGWDLSDLAAESGLGLGTLRKYSAGYREPKIEYREILAKTFKVKESEFYRPIEGFQQTSKKLESLDTQDLKKVLAEVINEGSIEQKEILEYAKNIPTDILKMLAAQDEIYFKSLRKVLEGLESKKNSPKKNRALA